MAKEEKVRLQIVLCKSVAQQLEKEARELDRSQAWVAGWTIASTLNDKYSFSNWLYRRLNDPEKYQKWANTGANREETRIQLRLDTEKAAELELIATAMNQSPLKLAGLMIEHGMDAFAPSFRVLKTTPGKVIRRWVRGKEDETKYDDVEASHPESEDSPQQERKPDESESREE